jgi:hypothetical protein
MAKAAAAETATSALLKAASTASPEAVAKVVETGHALIDHVDASHAKRWSDIAAKVKSMQPASLPKGGMKVGTAVVGAIAIGGGIYLASKLFSKPKDRQPNWADRIAAERRDATPQQSR